MKKEWYLNGESETIDLGKKIGAVLQAKDVVLLIGDLGCGKTTLTKGIGQALGVKQIINSPTFTIVKNTLESKSCTIWIYTVWTG